MAQGLGSRDFLSFKTSAAEGYACGEDGGFLTALDTSQTEALVREGLARELIRTIQEARKQAGLDVSDRIVLGITGTPGVEKALAEYRDYLMAETLAIEWSTGQSNPLVREQKSLDEENWTVEFSKVST
jgi:isoleucyl-tRNA synthetase